MEEYISMELARCYADAGLNILPLREDGTKAPSLSEWREYQQESTAPLLGRWYGNARRHGIGAITGAVSGDLECFEFDDAATYTAFVELAGQSGLAELVARIEGGYSERTPGGGVHWYYRCPETSGNTKLASRPEPTEDNPHRVKTLVETRGEGGFVVMAPSSGPVHPSGRPYDVLNGSVEAIAHISTDERRELWTLARSFDQMPIREAYTPREATENDGDRPGDLFNQRMSWAEILEPQGWKFIYRRGETAYWRRPGKTIGISASTGHTEADTLMVFSTSTPFDTVPVSYSKFAAYAVLNHGGDFAAAGKALWRLGYNKAVRVAGPFGTDTDAPEPMAFERSDAGNAELFAHLYGSRVRYDYARQRFLLWPEDGHRWGEPEGGEVMRLALDAVKTRFDRSWQSEDAKTESSFAIRSRDKTRLTSMVEIAKALHPIDAGKQPWDTNPTLLACPDGVVDLRTGEIRDGRQCDLITRGTTVRYQRGVKCPRWMRFLGEVFEGQVELIEFGQRAAGYSLTGETNEECLFLCHGGGRNGKSTLLSVLRAAAGEYAGNVSFTAFDRREKSTSGFDLVSIDGKRLVTASETSENTKLYSERIKALTGNDPINAARKYHDEYTFQPVAKFWLATNHLPTIDDNSEGMWSRIRLIPFTREFSEDERDNRLREKLDREMPGIFQWMLAGAREYYRTGLSAPEAVMAATAQYREDSDPLAEFLSTCCEFDETCSERATDLYQAYTQWAFMKWEKPHVIERNSLTETKFGRQMSSRFEGRKTRAGKTYHGIHLTDRQTWVV